MFRALLTAAALFCCGCGGGRAATVTATSTPAAAESPGCVHNVPGTRVIVAHAGGTSTPVAISGHGAIGVALLPQSSGDACQWSSFARVLEARGMRVARINWEGDYVGDALRAVRALRAAGAGRVALVGASLGGHIALIVAARHPAGVSAVVTLSAERTERSDRRDAARAARRIRIPALTIGSRNDGWTTFGAETRAIHRALRARVNVLRMVAGDAHGVDLLAGPRGARLTAEIVRFLRRAA